MQHECFIKVTVMSLYQSVRAALGLSGLITNLLPAWWIVLLPHDHRPKREQQYSYWRHFGGGRLTLWFSRFSGRFTWRDVLSDRVPFLVTGPVSTLHIAWPVFAGRFASKVQTSQVFSNVLPVFRSHTHHWFWICALRQWLLWPTPIINIWRKYTIVMSKRELASWCGKPADSNGKYLCAVNKTSQNSLSLGGVPISSSFVTCFESSLVIIKFFKATISCLNCIAFCRNNYQQRKRHTFIETITNLSLYLKIFLLTKFRMNDMICWYLVKRNPAKLNYCPSPVASGMPFP